MRFSRLGVIGLALALALPSTAFAARQRAQGAAPAAPRAPKDPLRSRTHQRAVSAAVRLESRHVRDGYPERNGTVSFAAAGAYLIHAPGVRETELRPVEYGDGKNQSQRIRVSGVGKDGRYRGTLIGTVSAHDLSNLDWPQFNVVLDGRIASDRIRVSYDHGPGTPRVVLTRDLQGKEATAVPLDLPLNRSGLTRVIYDRTDVRGRVVGDSGAYGGRIVEIEWGGN